MRLWHKGERKRAHEIEIIFHLTAHLNPQMSDTEANQFQVQFHVKALKNYDSRGALGFSLLLGFALLTRVRIVAVV